MVKMIEEDEDELQNFPLVLLTRTEESAEQKIEKENEREIEKE